jgi:hypothetical protein
MTACQDGALKLKIMNCLSCGLTSNTPSGEHVFSDWLLKELQCQELPMHFSRRYGDGTTSVHRTGITIGSFRLKRVCEGCNNGWMSRLEDRAKPILLPLMKGQRGIDSLQEDECRILAKWAGKTALIESRAIGAECPIDEKLLAWMRTHEDYGPGQFAVAGCIFNLKAVAHMQVGIIRQLIGGGKASGNIVVLVMSNVVLTCAFPMIAELPYKCMCDPALYHPLWPSRRSWMAMEKKFDPIPADIAIPDALVEFAERIELFQSVV